MKPQKLLSPLVVLSLLSFISSSFSRADEKREVDWTQAALDAVALTADVSQLFSGGALLSAPVVGPLVGGTVFLDGAANSVYHGSRLVRNLMGQDISKDVASSVEGRFLQYLSKRAGKTGEQQAMAGIFGDAFRLAVTLPSALTLPKLHRILGDSLRRTGSNAGLSDKLVSAMENVDGIAKKLWTAHATTEVAFITSMFSSGRKLRWDLDGLKKSIAALDRESGTTTEDPQF